MLVEKIGDDRWLVFHDSRLLDWCAAHISYVPDAGAWHREGAQALGIADGGDILAVMVVHGFQPRYGDAQISMAAATPKWASRVAIGRLLGYPFGQLGCQRITTLIAARNTRAIRFNEGIGFKREGLARRGFGKDDAVILGLLKEDVPAWAQTLASTHENA